MSQHFTHLHLHTEFSLLDGAIRLPDLMSMAQEQQWKAVGISDHGNIFGAVKFFQLALKANIKPVLGIEMYFTPDVAIKNAQEKYNHMIVIVQNKEGYKNLCRLIAYSFQQGYYFKPRIDYAILEKHSEGLIVTTACVGGHIPQMLRENNIEEAKRRTDAMLNIFGPDRFFFELQPAEFDKQILTNPMLIQYAQEWGVKCIATSDAHYLRKPDREAHEVMLSIQTKDLLSNPDRFSFGDCQAYLRTTDEMLAAFPNNHEAIWNTGFIADQCDFAFEFGKLFFPMFPIPETHTQDTYFAYLCKQGLDELKHQELFPASEFERYDARLQLEIDLIIKMGFVGYFLVVSDFIVWAKKQNIPVGPGRGSAAGSLVAWALQITNVDPIRYNLLFERFLNPERVSMPDIDIDFCIERREDVINYVKDKYGHDCVCQIITFGTMMAKGVLKDVARVLGFPYTDANAITDLIPEQLKITLAEAIEQKQELKNLIDNNPKVKHLFDIAFKLEGVTRHASKHAAGVVISPLPLSECLPLYVPGAKGSELVSQYAMTELESVGFLKMDFLGLQNLTVIERALKAIKKNHNVDINLDKLPLEDKKTFELLCKGKTKGVFQFESEGIGDVLRKLQPEKLEDLIAVNALYRPGPLGSGMVDDYIERKHGRKETTYMFPELEPILAETYGVIVYQEQVMKIASAIAGYTLGGADILRRAMGKKKAEEMAKQRALFVDGATQRGFDSKKASELFDLMEYFAGYGFNKSHSAAYAIIAYQTAYLKANYPHEFMAALVSFETDNPENLTKYLQEIHEMGITVTPPNINLSDIDFAARDGSVVFGLRGIRNVGAQALTTIIEERNKKPFSSLLEFCKRVDLRTANKRVLENLVGAGAMDCLPGNRAQKSAALDNIIERAHAHKETQKTGQMGLFGSAPTSTGENSDDDFTFAPLPDWSDKIKLEKEKEVCGFYLSAHPLKTYPTLQWIEATTFAQGLEMIKNVQSLKEPMITAYGLVTSLKSITTKKGDPMAFMQCEDMSGNAEIIIFPTLYKKVENLLGAHNVFIIKGTLDITATTTCKIKANELIPVDTVFDTETIKGLTLQLPEVVQEPLLESIKTTCPQGSVPLCLQWKENDQTIVLTTSTKVTCTLENLLILKNHNIQPRIAL